MYACLHTHASMHVHAQRQTDRQIDRVTHTHINRGRENNDSY